MSEPANLLMIEFLAWIASRRRTYSETMEAWQTTCPRHAIWENALIDDLIQLNRSDTIRDPEDNADAARHSVSRRAKRTKLSDSIASLDLLPASFVLSSITAPAKPRESLLRKAQSSRLS